MDVSRIRVGPHTETGHLHENIFLSDGRVLQIQGQHLDAVAPFSGFVGKKMGRTRKLCKPVQLERIGTWNVEGLLGPSRIKLVELYSVMRKQGKAYYVSKKHIYLMLNTSKKTVSQCFFLERVQADLDHILVSDLLSHHGPISPSSVSKPSTNEWRASESKLLGG